MIAPAPRKPMPVTICAAIRVGSAGTTAWPEFRNSRKPYAETIVNRADPTETSRWVRSPASRSRSSRSRPSTPPRAAASANRPSTSGHVSDGMLDAASAASSVLLGLRDPFDPAGGQLEQLVQALARERLLLGRRLHLDEPAVARHDHVHVDLRARILRVVEVEERLAVDDADRDGGDGVAQGLREAEAVECEPRRHVGAADRGAAGAAVGLEDVAVEPQGPLPERLEVGHRSQRPADQTLDLDRAAALFPARGLAVGALSGRRGQ